MKNFKLLTMALSAITLLSACESTASGKQAGKAEKPKPILCSRCKAEIKKETDKTIAAKREAEFMARMEKLKKRDPKRYADQMKRYNEHKAMQALRKKDPKAYRAKIQELRKKHLAKSEASFKARMEKLKKTDPKRYAAEMKRHNEYKELRALRKTDPKAYQAKMKELRKRQMAEREEAFKARIEKLKETDPKRYATEMKRYNEYKELRALRGTDPKAYQAKMVEFRKRQMAEREAAFKVEMEKLKRTNPKLYDTRMKRYNEYKVLQELRKKDPKAYQAKMQELRKKQMAEYKAKMAKRKAATKTQTTATTAK